MEHIKHFWSRAAPAGRRLRQLLALYLDDLCLLGAGGCFTAAAAREAGPTGALIGAGACLAVYAVVIARSRRGGGRR